MKKIVLVVLAGLMVGCSGSTTTNRTVTPPTIVAPSTTEPASTPPPIDHVLNETHDPGHVTGSLTGLECHILGHDPSTWMPDPSCTPGSIDPSIDAAVLCAPGYTTRSYRAPPSETTKFKYEQAYPAYGIDKSIKSELDHLVSLELGGSNSALNLWPEPGPLPNPKDAVENKLHKWVCDGGPGVAQGRLEAAQKAVANDWTTAEQVLGVS